MTASQTRCEVRTIPDRGGSPMLQVSGGVVAASSTSPAMLSTRTAHRSHSYKVTARIVYRSLATNAAVH
eukprot:1429215-Pyramimonas_sp.AAC.1